MAAAKRKGWKVGDKARTRYLLHGRRRRGVIEHIDGAYITLRLSERVLGVYPNEIERYQ